MPYNITNIGIASKGIRYTPGYLLASQLNSIALYDRAAISDAQYLAFEIAASGGDDFINKEVTANFNLFGQPVSITAIPSTGYINTLPTSGVPVFTSGITRENFECFIFNAGVFCYVIFHFYMTCDFNDYINASNNNNYRRFLHPLSGQSTGGELDNTPQSVYSLNTKSLNFTIHIRDLLTTAPAQPVPSYNGVGFATMLPFAGRWYDRNITANSYVRQLYELTVTAFAGTPFGATTIARRFWDGGISDKTDSNFQDTCNLLSPYDNNRIDFDIRNRPGQSFFTSAVVARLIRVDDITNDRNFRDDYELAEALIPQGIVVPSVLDGAVGTPSDWSNTAATIGHFTIDGTKLVFGGCYRVIISTYDNFNNLVTSHISQELKATSCPPCYPEITGTLSTLKSTFTGNDLYDVAPHTRLCAELDINRIPFEICTTYLGISKIWEQAFIKIILFVEDLNTGQTIRNLGYYDGVIDSLGYTPTPTGMNFKKCFFVGAEFAGMDLGLRWDIAYQIPDPTGGESVKRIEYKQLIHVNTFENDSDDPRLLGVRFLDFDAFYSTGEKKDVIDLCNREKLVVEIEKGDALNCCFQANIYKTLDANGDNISAFEEEEIFTVNPDGAGVSSSGLISLVDEDFAAQNGNEFAYFCIDVTGLDENVQYAIDGVAYCDDCAPPCDFCFDVPIKAETEGDGAVAFTNDGAAGFPTNYTYLIKHNGNNYPIWVGQTGTFLSTSYCFFPPPFGCNTNLGLPNTPPPSANFTGRFEFTLCVTNENGCISEYDAYFDFINGIVQPTNFAESTITAVRCAE